MAPLKQGEFKYSDTNYVLLGLLIEQLTQVPLHDFFRSAIFTPLGRQAAPPHLIISVLMPACSCPDVCPALLLLQACTTRT